MSKTGIAAALAHDGPVLVDAVVNRQELAMPPSITVEMAKGFTLYMVKAVMSGRLRRDDRSRQHEPVAIGGSTNLPGCQNLRVEAKRRKARLGRNDMIHKRETSSPTEEAAFEPTDGTVFELCE